MEVWLPEKPCQGQRRRLWTGSEGTSSSELREHNVESPALQVVGQNWSGGKVSLFLEGWELARVALSCHAALGMLCQEMHEAW